MNKNIIQSLRSSRPMLWERFKTDILTIQRKLKNPFFRGQGNTYKHIGNHCQTGWKLEPSLFRLPGTSHPSYIDWLKNTIYPKFKNEIETITTTH